MIAFRPAQRHLRRAVTLALAAGLCACASSGGGGGHNNSYSGDMAKLQSQCDARGGILTPTSRLTGRPETDYACTIHDASPRLNP